MSFLESVYGIIGDCGGTPSLQIAEINDLKFVDLYYFDKNELNDMLLSKISYSQNAYETNQ